MTKRITEYVSIGDGNPEAALHIFPLHTDDIALIVQGTQNGTQTEDLVSFRDSAGTEVAHMTVAGVFDCTLVSASIETTNVYAGTLTATNLSGITNIHATTITATTVCATDIKAVTITATTITGATTMRTTNLTATTISGTTLFETQIYTNVLTATNISGATNVIGATLSGTTVVAATISGATTLVTTNLTATTISGTTLFETQIYTDVLTATNISGATNIIGTTLSGTTAIVGGTLTVNAIDESSSGKLFGRYIASVVTHDATKTSADSIVMAASKTCIVDALVTAFATGGMGATGGGSACGYRVSAAFMMSGTSLIQSGTTVVTPMSATAAPATWVPGIEADDNTDRIILTATGSAGNDVIWTFGYSALRSAIAPLA